LKYVGLNYEDYVVQDAHFLRPSEVDVLISNPAKARQKLNWEPKVKFRELVEMMVEADLKRLKDAQ
jgi:GDPmannose 4,6-dehydratase